MAKHHKPRSPHKPVIRRGPRPSQVPLPVVIPTELRDAQRGVRLQKVLASAGVASRRDCEQLIQRGKVMVNGQTVTGLPAWVDPLRDRIEVNGHPIIKPAKSPLPGRDRFYVILNKPRAALTTTDDPAQRRHVMDLLPKDIVPSYIRLYPVGRLDADSTGLILLTNDGELAHRVTHPSFGVTKTYEVSVKGHVTAADLTQLQAGLFLAEKSEEHRSPEIQKVKIDQVRIVSHDRDRTRGERTTIHATLHEGHNRIIRRMLARLGFKVRRLHRIAVGPINLKGLARGACRLLEPLEVRQLRRAVGLDNAAQKK